MDDIAALIARLRAEGVVGAGARAEHLAGGFKNRVFRVRDGAADLVAKVYLSAAVDSNPYFPNRPDLEALVLDHLAGTGLAPEPVLWRAEQGDAPALLVYRHIEGKPWRADVTVPARLIGAVHQVAAPQGMRRVADSPAAILAHGDAMLERAGAALLPRRFRPRHADTAPTERPVLLHTDCGPGNIIVSGAGARLIDWQCPALGDATEDVACFLSPAMMRLYGVPPHDAPARALFLDAYGAGDAVERYRAEAASYHWRIACYCAWRAETLAASEPATAATYREALAAEIALLQDHVR